MFTRVLGISATQRGARGSLAWPGSVALTSQLACFSSDSHRGTEPRHTPNLEGIHNLADTEVERARASLFHVSMAKKLRKIDELASRQAFDTILGMVDDCYKPLFDNHAALRGVRRSLLDSYKDAGARAMLKLKPRDVGGVYNDAVTRRIERRAMEQFVTAKRPDLATAVYLHRRSMQKALGDKPQNQVADFCKHAKNFWQVAMSAFRALEDHVNAVAVYEDALASGAEPTARMTSTYATSLLAKRDHEAVRTLLDGVKRDGRPLDANYFRQMLYFTGVVQDATLMQGLREEMKSRDILLRGEDYMSAVRSLDSRYFQTNSNEKYQDYVDSIAAQKAFPETYAPIHDACKQVLALFDEMVDIANIEPVHKEFYPRVMRAAMILQDYVRVTQSVDLYKRTFGTPIAGDSSLAMTTNALLFRSEPEAAWNLVLNESQGKPPKLGIVTSLTSIVQYLDERQDHLLTRAFMSALKATKRLHVIRRDQRRVLIDSFVLDTENVSDASIQKLLRQNPLIFSVRTKIRSFNEFAKACMTAGRWSLLLDVLNTRDKKLMPTIPGEIILRISEAAMEDESNAERMKLAAALVPVVKAGFLNDVETESLRTNAARAVEVVRGFDTKASSRKKEGKNGDASAASPRREKFLQRVDARVSQLGELASSKKFGAMLRVVHECYKPLYETHPALQGVPCSLSESYDAAEAVEKETAPFVAMTYHDTATRHIESKAMEHFMKHDRPDLAAAVYKHRMNLATGLGSVTDEKSGHVTDFARHSKFFSQLAMSAFVALDDHEKVVSIYDEALKTDTIPPPAMTSMCAASLGALGEYDKVKLLYEAVKKDSRPVDHRFYWQVLYTAGKAQNATLAREAYKAIKSQDVPMRLKDYLSAIEAYGSQYFDPTVFADYQDYLNTFAAHKTSADSYANAHDACKHVLALFDEMVNVANIKPDHKAFYPRVMQAAMVLQDYERVGHFVDLYKHNFPTHIGNTSLCMATNALLFRGEPEAALNLALNAYEGRNPAQAPLGVVTSITSIFQYLKHHHDLSVTRAFLDVLEATSYLYTLRRTQRHLLFEAVVLDTEKTSDAAILELMQEYAVVFSVRTSLISLEDFAEACVKADRWSLLLHVMRSRDGRKIPTISGWLAVRISECAMEDEASVERMELVAEMTRVVDFAALNDIEYEIVTHQCYSCSQGGGCVIQNQLKPSQDGMICVRKRLRSRSKSRRRASYQGRRATS